MQQSMAMLSMQITFSLLHPPLFLPKSGPGAGPDGRACKILSASSILLYFCPNWVRESRQDWTSEIRSGADFKNPGLTHLYKRSWLPKFVLIQSSKKNYWALYTKESCFCYWSFNIFRKCTQLCTFSDTNESFSSKT